jgi:hypothetical protein
MSHRKQHFIPQPHLKPWCDPNAPAGQTPYVWFDPERYKRPPFYSQPALIYPSIEITLPISPRQMVVLNRRGLNGYSTVSWQRGLDDLNRRIRFCAHEYFIANSGAKKDIWFNPGIEPEDSWRKLHGKHQEE